MKIKPLHDRVVVRVQDSETRTQSGIVIPDNAKEKPTTGEVLAVGPGHYDNGAFVATSVTEGARILFGQFAGQKVKVENEEYTILRENDILAVLA
jgi:chaperonin GroES